MHNAFVETKSGRHVAEKVFTDCLTGRRLDKKTRKIEIWDFEGHKFYVAADDFLKLLEKIGLVKQVKGQGQTVLAYSWKAMFADRDNRIATVDLKPMYLAAGRGAKEAFEKVFENTPLYNTILAAKGNMPISKKPEISPELKIVAGHA